MASETRVLYNGQCPICSAEIAQYRRVARRDGLDVAFDDLSHTDLARYGVDTDTAARRLHVLKDGEVHAGFEAFLVLWQDLPRMRWLARALSLPGLKHMASLIYDVLLAPALYARHRRRQRQCAGPDGSA